MIFFPRCSFSPLLPGRLFPPPLVFPGLRTVCYLRNSYGWCFDKTFFNSVFFFPSLSSLSRCRCFECNHSLKGDFPFSTAYREVASFLAGTAYASLRSFFFFLPPLRDGNLTSDSPRAGLFLFFFCWPVPFGGCVRLPARRCFLG